MGMNKRNFTLATVLAASVFISLAANSKSGKGGGWGRSNTTFDDRWNQIFVTPAPAPSSGTVTNESSSVTGSSVDDSSYGTGEMNCRDTVFKISEIDNGSGVSTLSVPEIKHDKSATYACTSFSPVPKIAGYPADRGTVQIKCSNGGLRVIASTCESTPPPPVTDPVASTPPPAPADGGGTTTPPPANENGCPANYGYLTSNCGCCADATTTYGRYYGKNNNNKGGTMCLKQSISFKSCTNGKFWFTGTGACSASKPNAC